MRNGEWKKKNWNKSLVNVNFVLCDQPNQEWVKRNEQN